MKENKQWCYLIKYNVPDEQGNIFIPGCFKEEDIKRIANGKGYKN